MSHASNHWQLSAQASLLGGSLRGLVDLRLDLVEDLVLLLDLNGLGHSLERELARGRGQGAKGVLDADVLVETRDGIADGVEGGADRGESLGTVALLAVIDGLLEGLTDLVGDSVLAVQVATEVEGLKAAAGNALERLGDIVVLIARKVGGGREGGRANPDTTHEQAREATEHARGSHLGLGGDLHERDGLLGLRLSLEGHARAGSPAGAQKSVLFFPPCPLWTSPVEVAAEPTKITEAGTVLRDPFLLTRFGAREIRIKGFSLAGSGTWTFVYLFLSLSLSLSLSLYIYIYIYIYIYLDPCTYVSLSLYIFSLAGPGPRKI